MCLGHFGMLAGSPFDGVGATTSDALLSALSTGHRKKVPEMLKAGS
jgi:hypothetical protein